MKARIVLALAMILLLTGSASVAASGPEVPFYTSLQVHPTFAGPITEPPGGFMLDVPGEGQATHLGDCTWHTVMRVYFDGTQDGDMEFVAANGDQLFGTFEGEWVLENGVNTFWGTYEFDGGTGRFERVGGTGDYWGESPGGGTGVLYFEGKLIKADKPQP